MPYKSFYTAVIAFVMLCGTAQAELFAPFHKDAFAGFGIKNPIFNLKKLGPINRSTVRKKLWSDDYWPVYTGGLAYRYADPGFWINSDQPKPTDWKIPGSHILKNYPAAQLIRSGLTNSLSPAEKYDLLVGDVKNPNDKKAPGYSLTRAHIKDLTKKTQNWEGSCDGWAFAAINEPPPVKAVTVKNRFGQPITFYPSDIRALLTLLYSDYDVYSFGQLCKVKKPRVQGASSRSAGRVINHHCRDLNPGIFHTVLINQVGIGKRSFVVDSDYSAEVWNVPVVSYQAEYYNPQTFKDYKDAFSARVPINQYTVDPFDAYRDRSRVAYVVGVTMKIRYQVENFPQAKMRLDANHDKAFDDLLNYDLELDAQGNIIGGEWAGYSQANHPDIISYVAKRDLIRTEFDHKIRGNSLPEMLRSIKPEYAAKASSRKRPLYKVIKALARMSQ